MKIVNNQSLVSQLNSIKILIKTGFLCPFNRTNKGLAFFIRIFIIINFPFNLLAQGCDYLPGDISLNHSEEVNSDFYTTDYFIIDINQKVIKQINSEPTFLNVKKGIYEAYAVTYKIGENILNFETGKQFDEINSICLSFSTPFLFSVCSQPILNNLEKSLLKVCADNNSTISITDSITFKDIDGVLDTFSIIISIIESPDSYNDTLDVDLTPFIGLSKKFNAGSLEINNIRSPLQVQAILRTIYFYSASKIKGNRIIEFQVSNGINLSNPLNREIIVTPLPSAPIQILRKKKE